MHHNTFQGASFSTLLASVALAKLNRNVLPLSNIPSASGSFTILCYSSPSMLGHPKDDNKVQEVRKKEENLRQTQGEALTSWEKSGIHKRKFLLISFSKRQKN